MNVINSWLFRQFPVHEPTARPFKPGEPYLLPDGQEYRHHQPWGGCRQPAGHLWEPLGGAVHAPSNAAKSGRLSSRAIDEYMTQELEMTRNNPDGEAN